MDKVKAFLKENWKHVVTLLVMLGGFSFVKFQKGEKFEVYIVLPDEIPDIFGAPPAAKAVGETFSPRALTALRMAGVRLRNDDSDGGRKLFAVLQRLHNDPYSLDDVEAATKATAIDPLTLSLIAKIALKIAVAYLEVRAPRTESQWDDRLLALLKLFADRPETINAAHAAIVKRGP